MKRHEQKSLTSEQTVVNKKAVVFELVYQNLNLSETQISRYCTIKNLILLALHLIMKGLKGSNKLPKRIF